MKLTRCDMCKKIVDSAYELSIECIHIHVEESSHVVPRYFDLCENCQKDLIKTLEMEEV